MTEAALNKLRDAGAELVPFDSSLFDELSSSAWVGTAEGGLDGASSYEAPTTLARYRHRPLKPPATSMQARKQMQLS